MRSTLPILLVLMLATPGLAGDGPSDSPRPLAIGDEAPAFELPVLQGGTFKLAEARQIDGAKALEQVLAAAKDAAAGDEVTADTTLASLKGLAGEDGNADPAKVRALVQAAGTPYGLIADEDQAEDLETVEDVVTWITDSASAPIVLMCWSPMCPTSRRYEKRIQAVVAAAGARFYPLASYSNRKERDEDTLTYVRDNHLPYRVVLDREQKGCDIFGGKVTPHVFVLDGENRFVYAGSIDSDPNQETKSAYERQNWLADALEAIANEVPVDVMRTRAKG